VADPQPPPQKRVNVELPGDLNAIYANFAIISHSPTEVIIDFAQILPGMTKARVQSRILLTPANAKMLYQALGQNLAKYERNVGKIPQPGKQAGSFDPQKGTLGGMEWTVSDDDEDSSPEPPPEE
jgi:hypothetical protein